MANDRTASGIDPILNQLYWNSSRTIDEIIAEAGVGRNILYASIEPVEAGMDCPSCTEILYFTNRTNRSSGTATCLVCGQEEAMVLDHIDRMIARNALDHSSRNGESAGIDPGRLARIGSGGAIGLILGALIVRAMRR
jgi:hypothetical protein